MHILARHFFSDVALRYQAVETKTYKYSDTYTPVQSNNQRSLLLNSQPANVVQQSTTPAETSYVVAERYECDLIEFSVVPSLTFSSCQFW